MTVKTLTLSFETEGNTHIIDITGYAQQLVFESGVSDGILTLFVPGSTAALTTIEYEEGALTDFRRLFEEIAPQNREYAHNRRWGDDNGHSHVRASLLGPSLTIPFAERRLTLGTWQQIVFVDFDNEKRNRRVIAQVMGE